MTTLANAGSAADLKFLQQMKQTRLGPSNRKAALESWTCSCPFVFEVRVRGCCNDSRTSETGHEWDEDIDGANRHIQQQPVRARLRASWPAEGFARVTSTCKDH
jgi:hypothetical protein